LFRKRHKPIATRTEYYTRQSDEVSSVNANMAEPGRMHELIWCSRAIADKEINDVILVEQALRICTTRNHEKSITIERWTAYITAHILKMPLSDGALRFDINLDT